MRLKGISHKLITEWTRLNRWVKKNRKRAFLIIISLGCLIIIIYREIEPWIKLDSPFYIQYEALFSELIVRVSLKMFPIAVAFLMLDIFLSHRTWSDLDVLGHSASISLDTSASSLSATNEIFRHQHDLAVKRFTLIGLALTGAIAAGTWMRDANSRRFDVTSHLRGVFQKEEVVKGRILLRNDPYTQAPFGKWHCEFCYDLCAAFVTTTNEPSNIEKNSNQEGDTKDKKQRLINVREALNAVELILYLRESGTVSESEFHMLWGGLAGRVVADFQEHYLAANEDSCPDLKRYFDQSVRLLVHTEVKTSH